MSNEKKPLSTKKVSDSYYLRDAWTIRGETRWMRRHGEHLTLMQAKAEAKRMAKSIGKGARVQVIRVRSEVAAEVAR